MPDTLRELDRDSYLFGPIRPDTTLEGQPCPNCGEELEPVTVDLTKIEDFGMKRTALGDQKLLWCVSAKCTRVYQSVTTESVSAS